MVSGAGPTWPDLLTRLLAREDLSLDESRWAMTRIMGGEASSAQVAGFLMALRSKVESVAEVRGLADVMLEHAHRIEIPGESIDISGTGGDRFGTVNISTMSSVVIASTGLRVVKHGNRAASSKSGSADVLESLGVNLSLTPDQVRRVGLDAGITFCFAQTFHPSMRHAGPARAELGVGTAFNLLGPLTNPAQPTYAAVGVADVRFLPIIAGVFADRGQVAAVFRGEEGLDEMSIAGPTRVLWVREGKVTETMVHPSDVGLEVSTIDSIKGGLADENAEVARRVFAGDRGPARDAVLLNAGTALAVASGADHSTAAEIHDAIGDGVQRAAAAIDSGEAAAQLERWIASSRAVAD
ncbi:anthranilate phosphoribosyltransferase [Knoellia subterranea]|uniref:Anthranilate phosphoribosyltransferase n=1 Tax=Knoellia subterranea KCTC 19937 TaxID=1385521 RepID=A0A0A0JP07_9MICO|nr:anthranilate phosphoribosyltransferase [Knoellia subterranea]KGN38474.1 anthranilate phosphoribosyltransferase [Knoellia subterranea KCTC 19937]